MHISGNPETIAFSKCVQSQGGLFTCKYLITSLQLYITRMNCTIYLI